MKIFVSIVSYRDPLLHYTLKSLMENKSEITDVVYGIFEQTATEDSLAVKYPELANHPDV
jgi:Glycosyltransferase (GlcNAc)